MSDAHLGELVDSACTEILRRKSSDRGARLVVHPAVYHAVATARQQEIDRGVPLMLLGLELQGSAEVPPHMFRIVQ